MPGWTLRQILSESTRLAGIDGSMEQSRVSQFVNQAIQDIAVRTPMAEKETVALTSTVSGESKFYLPADCDEIITLSYQTAATGSSENNWDSEDEVTVATNQYGGGHGGQVIRQASPWEVDSQSEGTFTGVPDRYLAFGSWVELYPSPNSAYSLQLRYYARISDLTNLDLAPSIATGYHYGVVLKTAELLAQGGDTARAAYFANRYISFMESTPDIQKRRLRDRTGAGFRVQMTED